MSPRSRSTAGPALLAQELNPAGAVDEVEEDELPVPAAGHHAAGDPPLLGTLLAGSSGSASARTEAMSTRSGKRLGNEAMTRESSGGPATSL